MGVSPQNHQLPPSAKACLRYKKIPSLTQGPSHQQAARLEPQQSLYLMRIKAFNSVVLCSKEHQQLPGPQRHNGAEGERTKHLKRKKALQKEIAFKASQYQV